MTLGGVDTNELSSRTMEARKVPGLYFIGEVMDVTGWLGGYNFPVGVVECMGLCAGFDCSEVVLSYFLKMKIIRVALKMS
ncbi:oxidoreductase [Escherichia coli]|uniref:Oxidoreductase n=1 Tax=Escherichia coli TaxID=562 RepID=A0A485JBJ1_ECOLX|nr:oxidoreductase [Escherichia coli]